MWLSEPDALAFDASGNLFVSNWFDDTIKQLTPSGVIATKFFGPLHPTGLACDSTGNLYIGNAGVSTISEASPIPATTQVTIQSSLPSRPMSWRQQQRRRQRHQPHQRQLADLHGCHGYHHHRRSHPDREYHVFGCHRGHHPRCATQVVQSTTGAARSCWMPATARP